jgi:hypothetical protein
MMTISILIPIYWLILWTVVCSIKTSTVISL